MELIQASTNNMLVASHFLHIFAAASSRCEYRAVARFTRIIPNHLSIRPNLVCRQEDVKTSAVLQIDHNLALIE